MRKNISDVIDAFIFGTAKGTTRDTCSTHGGMLYSYALPIAWRDADGLVVVHSESGQSRTTVSQIRAVKVALRHMLATPCTLDHDDCRKCRAIAIACNRARAA